jgi:DNA-directed RNA polymerase specialized sigma24 family protein
VWLAAGITQAEIARRLGKSQGFVDQRISELRTEIAAQLERPPED